MAAEQAHKKGPRHLHPSVKLVWFAPTAIVILMAWLIVSAIAFTVGAENFLPGVPRLAVAAGLLFALLLFFGAPVFLYNHIEYLSFTYELTENEVVIREGVLTRKTAVIPYLRIQNINTLRTLFERFLNLATLQIDTAGTNPGASEGILPGVANKEQLIAEILSHVEKAKKGTGEGGGLGGGGDGAEKLLRTEADLLSDILKELVQLNKSITSHYGKGSHAETHGGSQGEWKSISLPPPSNGKERKK